MSGYTGKDFCKQLEEIMKKCDNLSQELKTQKSEYTQKIDILEDKISKLETENEKLRNDNDRLKKQLNNDSNNCLYESLRELECLDKLAALMSRIQVREHIFSSSQTPVNSSYKRSNACDLCRLCRRVDRRGMGQEGRGVHTQRKIFKTKI